jgi:hypothetical protein
MRPQRWASADMTTAFAALQEVETAVP